MALSRKFLSALGIEQDKQDEIIAAHTETVDALKDEISKLKTEADRLPAVQKELDELKKAAEEMDGKNPYRVKYEALKEEYDSYKNEQTAKETKAAKTKAYRALLKEAGVSEKRIDSVLRVSDVDGIELDKDGSIKGAAALTESIKTEWADFIQTSETNGAKVTNPPENNGSKLTREQIYAKDDKGRYIMDSTARQKALSDLQTSDNS